MDGNTLVTVREARRLSRRFKEVRTAISEAEKKVSHRSAAARRLRLAREALNEAKADWQDRAKYQKALRVVEMYESHGAAYISAAWNG